MKFTKTPVTTKIIVVCLAISDTCVLVSNFPGLIIRRLLNGDYFRNSSDICRIIMFQNFLFPAMSNWLVAMLTVERALAVLLPLELKVIVTKTKVKLVILVLLLLHILWVGFITSYFGMNRILDDSGQVIGSSCSPKSHYMALLVSAWVTDNFIPLIFVFASNTVIGVTLLKRKSQTTELGTTPGRLNEFRLVAASVAVSVAFLVLSTPFFLYYIPGALVLGDDIYKNPNNPFLVTADCLYRTNFAINFYLYVAFTENFRMTMMYILTRIKLRCCQHRSRIGISSVRTESNYPV